MGAEDLSAPLPLMLAACPELRFVLPLSAGVLTELLLEEHIGLRGSAARFPSCLLIATTRMIFIEDLPAVGVNVEDGAEHWEG